MLRKANTALLNILVDCVEWSTFSPGDDIVRKKYKSFEIRNEKNGRDEEVSVKLRPFCMNIKMLQTKRPSIIYVDIF